MIDRIRHDFQRRLERLQAEARKLPRTLAALDPRGRFTSTPTQTSSRPDAQPPVTPSTAAHRAPARTPARATSTVEGAATSGRAGPGQTKVRILAALSTDHAMTAGEVATATGVARPTVSTTLSRLTKTGEVEKADRGYRLPSSDDGNAGAGRPAAS